MADESPFLLADEEEIAARQRDRRHIYGNHVICVTEAAASPKNEWRSDVELMNRMRSRFGDARIEIVVDATEGFIPLWAQGSKLHWCFDNVSMQAFRDPAAARKAVRALFHEALEAWGSACPVAFVENNRIPDFKFVMRSKKRCNPSGCVLASAFFPDGGRHELTLYPSLFEQPRSEQVETLVHEIGHIFGLRHFFANVSETAWPSVIYGTHNKFSIMNYGSASVLTDADRSDLQKLYAAVWDGQVSSLNGTPIRLMRPYSTRYL